MSRFRIGWLRAFFYRYWISKRYPPSAKADRPRKPQFSDGLLRDIGAIAVIWSQIEGEWCMIFRALLREADPAKANAMLRQFQTSSAQRDLVMATAAVTANLSEELRLDLGALHAESNIVAGERNVYGVDFNDREARWALIFSVADHCGKPNSLGGRLAEPEALRIRRRASLLRRQLERFRETLEADPLDPPAARKRRRAKLPPPDGQTAES